MSQRALCLQADNGFRWTYEADSQQVVSHIFLACIFNCKVLQLNMQEYRSGHNEAVLKTVGLTARGFESLFLRHKRKTPLCWCFFFYYGLGRGDSHPSLYCEAIRLTFSGFYAKIKLLFESYSRRTLCLIKF